MGQGVTIESSAHAPKSAGSNVSILSIPFACMAATMCKSTDHRSKKAGRLDLVGTAQRHHRLASAGSRRMPATVHSRRLQQASGPCLFFLFYQV
jgi:hypothetical protein